MTMPVEPRPLLKLHQLALNAYTRPLTTDRVSDATLIELVGIVADLCMHVTMLLDAVNELNALHAEVR